MSESSRLSINWDFWKLASLCLGAFAVLGCFNSEPKGVLAVVSGVWSIFMPWVLMIIYYKGDRKSKMNEYCATLIAIFAMFVLFRINDRCIQWINEISNLKSSEVGGSWFSWIAMKADVNAVATLFVGFQWCALYVLKGWLVGNAKEHFVRLNRVLFMLLGTLVSALGLPWGFPVLVALGELYYSSCHKSSVQEVRK